MDTTLFLSQVFGLYFLIAGAGLLLKQSVLKSMLTRISLDQTLIRLGSFMALLIGIPLVLVHNLWSDGLESIISIIAWLTLTKGVVGVLMPNVAMSASELFLGNTSALKAVLWVLVILGAYLTYVGFTA